MGKLSTFENPNFGNVRVIDRDGDPWFVAVDVCKCLEIANSRDALKRLDADERGVVSIDTRGGRQSLGAVNESGLYSLVVTSRKPEAKAFKRWITHEVLPAIRKHGAYMTPETIKQALLDPDTIITIATNLKMEMEKNKILTQKIKEDEPKVKFALAVESSKTAISIGDMAKLLRQNGVETGRNRLAKWLRNNGYLIKRGESFNMPTQYSMDRGILEVKETVFTNGNYSRIVKTPMVTGKGQAYFAKKLLGY